MKSQLFLFTVDHLSGEDLGQLVERAYVLGARSVHVVASVTKKGRPGHVVLLDATGQDEEPLCKALGAEFGVSGWHRLQGTHQHETTHVRYTTVEIEVEHQTVAAELRIKVVGPPGRPLFRRIEHDDLVALAGRMAEHTGAPPSLALLRRRLVAQLDTEAPIRLRFEP